MKKRRLLQVTWNDSCGLRNGWRGGTEVGDMVPSRIESVGFVVSDTVTHITLTASVDEFDNMCGEICIPKGCISSESEYSVDPARPIRVCGSSTKGVAPVPKTSKRKPKSSARTVGGTSARPRVQRHSGEVAGQRGDGKRIRGLAAVDPPAVLVQPDEPACADVPLKPGWAEVVGASEAARELKESGREPRKAYAHSLETRAKMKAAQRARRAREFEETR